MCKFYRRGQKSIFNDTKFDIFGDKCLSQDLIFILGNIGPTLQLCQERQRGVGERGHLGLVCMDSGTTKPVQMVYYLITKENRAKIHQFT